MNDTSDRLLEAARAHWRRYKDLSGEREIEMKVIAVTPALASIWLSNTEKKRYISTAMVSYYTRQMEAGNWMLAEPLILGAWLNLLNGSHRCYAVVECQMTVEFVVLYGVSEEAFLTMDTGANRKGKDWLALVYPERSAAACACLAVAYQWYHQIATGWHTREARRKLDPREVVDDVDENQEWWECVEHVLATRHDEQLLPKSAIAACFFMFQKRDPELAEEYITQFLTGNDLSGNDVAHVIRRDIIKQRAKNPLRKYTPREAAAMLIKGWNCRRRRRHQISIKGVRVYPNDKPRWPEVR